MIYIVFLFMMVGIMATMAFFFVPFVFFLVGAFGVMIGVGPTLIIIYLIAPRMFYYKFRVYEDRGEGAHVEFDVRAKKVEGKDGYEYLETPTGARFRFSELKYFISGTKGQLFGDVFRVSGTGKESQVFPIKCEFGESEKIKARKKIIPVEQRAWFSNNRVLGYIKEVTKMPMDAKLAMIQTMTFMGAVIMVAVIMIFYPTYVIEMEEVYKGQVAALEQKHQDLADIYKSESIVCQYELVNPGPIQQLPPPEPPPQ